MIARRRARERDTGTVGSARGLRRAVGIAACCVPLLAGCATGFGAPTRTAVANYQAAATTVGPHLQIHDLIVAIPTGDVAAKGGVAYIEFTAINPSGQPDQLQNASATTHAEAPSPTAVAPNIAPVGSTTIPAKNAVGPGVARLVVALQPLAVQLRQGDSVQVSLQFADSGTVQDLLVPVKGVSASFVPSSPPPLPSSPAPPTSPASSPTPGTSAVSSAPPASSVPASSALASTSPAS